jgi:hypothetical protein
MLNEVARTGELASTSVPQTNSRVNVFILCPKLAQVWHSKDFM